MNIRHSLAQFELSIKASGTSEGANKGWDSRGRGRAKKNFTPPSSVVKGKEDLAKKYPKAVASSKKVQGASYGKWNDIKDSKNPRLELEKHVVYKALSENGPDVAYEKIGRVLPQVRKAAGGDILLAHEDGRLVDAVGQAGLLGPSSDKLRHSADKYY